MVFFLTGVAFLPHLGIQNDEALFSSPLYQPKSWLYAITPFHWRIPLLLMSYLGTLKSWLYRPILNMFGVTVMTIRLPMVAAGALSVWCFFLLLRRIAGDRAAVIGCCLLAADSLYLLTSCFDWGPVAMQHLLITGGLLLVVQFHQTGRPWPLFAGFLLFGLAFWDKALAVWMLSALAIAGISTLHRQIVAILTPRRAAIAAGAFCLGALPVLIANAAHPGITFEGNAARDTSNLPSRARMLRNTLEGQGLFGWLIQEDAQTPQPHSPAEPIDTFAAKVSELAGHPRHNLMLCGLLLALALAPLAGGRGLRAVLFGVIAMAVAWIQMATTANAGGSVHHTILLWPLPAMVMAISFDAAIRRLFARTPRAALAAAVMVTVLLAGSELLVTSEYYAVMVRNGGSTGWADAVFTLSEYLKALPVQKVYCVDWGIFDSLRLLNQGHLPLEWGGDLDREALAARLREPGRIFIGHTADRAFFPETAAKVVRLAQEAGYRREMLAVVADSYGRATFEVYRFVP